MKDNTIDSSKQTTTTFNSHILSVSSVVFIRNFNDRFLTGYGEYFHQEKKTEITPSISFGKDCSIGFSASTKKYMRDMKPNVSFTLKYLH